MDLDGFVTLVDRAHAEDEPVKGSRHIGDAAPCKDADEAAAFLAEIRAREPHATHHAWAWRLAPDGANCRCSDDGEPSGTAGRPILRQLEASELVDVMVVVTRYFGGTKLGAGGLARAYSGAARVVLEAAETVRVVPLEQVWMVCGYAEEAAVRRLIGDRDLRLVDAVHGQGVRLRVELPVSQVETVAAALTETTHGRARLERDA